MTVIDVRTSSGVGLNAKINTATQTASGQTSELAADVDGKGRGPGQTRGQAYLRRDPLSPPFQGANIVAVDASIIMRSRVDLLIDSGILFAHNLSGGNLIFSGNAGPASSSVRVGDRTSPAGRFDAHAAGKFVVSMDPTDTLVGGAVDKQCFHMQGVKGFILDGFHFVQCRKPGKQSQHAAWIADGTSLAETCEDGRVVNFSAEGCPGGYGIQQSHALKNILCKSWFSDGGTVVRQELDAPKLPARPYGFDTVEWDTIVGVGVNGLITFAPAWSQGIRHCTYRMICGFAMKNGIRSNRPASDYLPVAQRPTGNGVSDCQVISAFFYGDPTAQDQGNEDASNLQNHHSLAPVDLNAAITGLTGADLNVVENGKWGPNDNSNGPWAGTTHDGSLTAVQAKTAFGQLGSISGNDDAPKITSILVS